MTLNTQALVPPTRWKQDAIVAAIWGVLAGLSVAAVIPYLLQLAPDVAKKIPVPLPVLATLQAAQAFLLLGLLSFLGLRMGHAVGLGSPLMRSLVERSAPAWQELRPLRSVVVGVLAALVVIAASRVLDPLLPAPLHPIADPGAGRSALNGLLASFYGGIAEELQLRLFLMTLLVWLFSRFGRNKAGSATYWVAIAIASLLFGIGHLPAAAQVWGLDAIVIVRTVALNAIAGIAFGWLFWKRGIEMAMLAHFSADIVLHVLAPLLGSAG